MSDNNNLQQQLNITLQQQQQQQQQQQAQQASTPKQQNVEVKNTQTTGKRKKTLRACYHCQKAHLTCDDGIL